MIDSKNPEIYHFNKNVIEKNKWLGFQKRNIIEACLSVLILFLILFIIPFTPLVRIVFMVFFGGALFIFNLRGIRGRSVTQMLLAEYRFRKNKRILHLRGPEWNRKKGGGYIYDEKAYDEQIKEFLQRTSKRVDEFVDENS